ncbi:hypothetical protein HYH03_015479 [Edaphochlamys debaryana]|uniref:Uncharacterized protein n=1 Tax=Edaphochlamys debaryana TaxID=47281 RepID=A0A835XRR5_9CHLO|nr:hypothetical protein HYH03_015479 [Edaphochlamys debaryana]|eukprot:KAG2485765.1 hypothetical protein HYH03_015479 [Edaphochlamys debaryana]
MPALALHNGSLGLSRTPYTSGRVARCQRLARLVPAARPNWRAEVESSVDAPASPSPSPSAPSSSSAPFILPATTPTTAAEQPPPRPRDPERPFAGDSGASMSSSSSMDEGSRAEPLSLPTLDIVDLFSTSARQAQAFTVLAGSSAVLALLCAVEPEAVLELALPGADFGDLDVTFTRIIGVTLAASASVEYSLKHAAESQLLKSATYQRLMAGCALKSAGFLAVFLANLPATAGLWAAPAWMGYLVAAVGSMAVNLAVITNTSGSGLALPAVELSVPKSNASWGYAACTALYLLTVAACFAPETLFTGDPYTEVTPLVKGVWAPGFLLAAVMSWVLKDAGDRGRLGASTFKNLNLGLAALEYGYAVIFCSAMLSDQVEMYDAAALSNLVGSLGIASFALYTYTTEKK